VVYSETDLSGGCVVEEVIMWILMCVVALLGLLLVGVLGLCVYAEVTGSVLGLEGILSEEMLRVIEDAVEGGGRSIVVWLLLQ